MFPSKTLSKSFAQCQRHSAPPANGCGRLRAVDNGCGSYTTTIREQDSTPRPPQSNENPSLRIWEKRIRVAYPSLPPVWLNFYFSFSARHFQKSDVALNSSRRQDGSEELFPFFATPKLKSSSHELVLLTLLDVGQDRCSFIRSEAMAIGFEAIAIRSEAIAIVGGHRY